MTVVVWAVVGVSGLLSKEEEAQHTAGKGLCLGRLRDETDAPRQGLALPENMPSHAGVVKRVRGGVWIYR